MEVLFTKEQIAKRIKDMAGEISEKYKNKKLTLVGVLRGCAPFLVDLMRELDPSLDIEIDFISVGSYGKAHESSGVVKIHKGLTGVIAERNVIIIDDVCDSGRTIQKLKKMFETECETCEVAVLLSKPSRRVVNVELEYVGFVIPDKFVVGYGMDDGEKLRNLSEIYVI